MSEENVQKSTTITLFKTPPAWCLETAFLILLCAKVFGYADLSWWTVTCPLWGPIAICFGFLFAFYAIALVITAIMGVFAAALMGMSFLWNKFKKLFGIKKHKKETTITEIEIL